MTASELAASNRLRREFFVVGFSFDHDAYAKLLKHQKGVCAICGGRDKSMRLAVDHDHTTGLIRGLLCMRCNRAYGLFHDGSAPRLRAAADYLEAPPCTVCFGKPLKTAVGKLGTKVRAKHLAALVSEHMADCIKRGVPLGKAKVVRRRKKGKRAK